MSHVDSRAKLADGDLIAVEAVGAATHRRHLILSFHGDTAGVLTLPVLKGVHRAIQHDYTDHVAILGLDANSYEKAKQEQLSFKTFVEELKSMGFTSCFGDNPDTSVCKTTCCARTSLQPQLNKAVRYDDRVQHSDMNPKDNILFQSRHLAPASSHCLGQPNPLKDNTGRLFFRDETNFPTLEFPSDHSIVAAVLEYV